MFQGPAVVVVSCVTHDGETTPRAHPHNLVSPASVSTVNISNLQLNIYLIQLGRGLIWLHSLEYWICRCARHQSKVFCWRHLTPNFCCNVFKMIYCHSLASNLLHLNGKSFISSGSKFFFKTLFLFPRSLMLLRLTLLFPFISENLWKENTQGWVHYLTSCLVFLFHLHTASVLGEMITLFPSGTFNNRKLFLFSFVCQ